MQYSLWNVRHRKTVAFLHEIHKLIFVTEEAIGRSITNTIISFANYAVIIIEFIAEVVGSDTTWYTWLNTRSKSSLQHELQTVINACILTLVTTKPYRCCSKDTLTWRWSHDDWDGIRTFLLGNELELLLSTERDPCNLPERGDQNPNYRNAAAPPIMVADAISF